jgi:hypothetical protein
LREFGNALGAQVGLTLEECLKTVDQEEVNMDVGDWETVDLTVSVPKHNPTSS